MSETGTWSEASIAGHVCDIYEPATRNSNGYVVIYLHGVHQAPLSGHSAFVDLFEENGLTVIGPRTKRSWWTDKICREFDENVSAQQYLLDFDVSLG
ncbi:esterase, partial [Planctomycetota bacterium]